MDSRDTGFQVPENDEFPNQICTECESQLIQCYEFKNKCISSTNLLKSALFNRESNKEFETGIIEQESPEISQIPYSCFSEINAISQDAEESLTAFLEDKSRPLLHKCAQCSQSYNDEHDLKLHESTHTSALKCIRCNKNFISA